MQHESSFKQSMVSLKSFVDAMMRGDMDTTINESSVRYAVHGVLEVLHVISELL